MTNQTNQPTTRTVNIPASNPQVLALAQVWADITDHAESVEPSAQDLQFIAMELVYQALADDLDNDEINNQAEAALYLANRGMRGAVWDTSVIDMLISLIDSLQPHMPDGAMYSRSEVWNDILWVKDLPILLESTLNNIVQSYALI